MSAQETNLSTSPDVERPPGGSADPGAPRERFLIPPSWRLALVVAAIMILLAMVGVGLTTASSDAAPIYWISLVPFYGVLCIATAWRRSRYGVTFEPRLVLRQVWHWLGIGIALGLDFLIRGTGEESGLGAGLNALLLLALGCYLAGVHLEWPFTVVGVLLTGVLLIVTKADQYAMHVVLVGTLAVVVLIALSWWLGRERSRKQRAEKPS